MVKDLIRYYYKIVVVVRDYGELRRHNYEALVCEQNGIAEKILLKLGKYAIKISKNFDGRPTKTFGKKRQQQKYQQHKHLWMLITFKIQLCYWPNLSESLNPPNKPVQTSNLPKLSMHRGLNM